MYLKELSINGFKSFAKKSELEFSAPITAIVGPNGSGKSNVAESFRFVLGEQSVKSMRGKKGEDLIWGGGDKVARGNRAAVEVVFDNTNRTFSLDFDEITIERIVHRDGQNEYKLNGSQVRLRDIHELLAGANIGSTGHHIISQGEADRVLSAGPKERRQMIEDALGLKVYQLKKQEADRKLQKTLDNIAQVESLRREAAPHLRYLKKQVERAERSLQVQAELSDRYAEYLRREDTYIAVQFDEKTAARHEPEKQLAEVQTKIVVAKEKLDQHEIPTESVALSEAKQTAKEATAAWQAAQHELSQLEGQISFLERRIEAAKQPRSATQKLVPLHTFVSLVEDISTVIQKAVEKGGEQSLQETLQKIAGRLRDFIADTEEKTVDMSEADTAELKKLQPSVETIETEVKKLLEKKQTADAQVFSLQESRVGELEEKRTAEKELFSLLQEQRELESVVRTIDSELAILNRDREDFKQELQEAVTLLGRGASNYFSYQVMTTDGQPVTDLEIASEDRTSQRTRRRELEKLKIRLEELGIGATDDLLKEYKDAQERDTFLERELADLNQSVENLNALIAEMQVKLEEQFVQGVEKIGTEFNRFFMLMFGGGSAKLEQVSIKRRGVEEDASEEEETGTHIEEGVELNVSLPNKRVRGLDMLSGGERALTSIALIFAMSQVNPPPFIILDETDAALDEANSRRYGDMIEALAKKSQLVLITHNRETMSRAGILYGITMGADGVSKLLSVKFADAVVNAK